ncbi:MAG TPA: glucose 1-dehydrogenase [Thermoanaerobaculia bacterium]|jgi:NAD(P)-dependent dehydrogenase (short-subunit alcohol dehydrogenase family)|nr:glucose 1-dehydrogenase [Thermoanaerobaculia bacterium]
MKLKDRVAIVTGATSGIGAASARLFAEEGARVAVSGRDESRGREVAAAIDAAGGAAVFVRADVRIADDCRRLVAETLRAFGGRLDVLFNNAGVYHPHNAIDCTEEEWDATLDSSLKGAWLMSKYALPTMIAQRGGVIIHQASGWGIQGGDQAVAYCAAKGGVVVMTKAMAIDHGPQGIRVNCLCPGDVDTPMLPEDARARGLNFADYMKGAANRPLGRVGTAEELARAALFLASDDSSFMTGAALVVDGGGIAD